MLGQVYQPPLDERISLFSQLLHRFLRRKAFRQSSFKGLK
jgi:hypothetical protein